MSELDSIVQKAGEVHGISLLSVYISAGPRAQTAVLLNLQTGANLVYAFLFLTRVGALGMWPHVARESRQGGCT